MRQEHRLLINVLLAVLAVWSILLFFESAYFGAGFYGFPVPSWDAWVGTLPIWTFNAIDTVMVAVLVAVVVLAAMASRRRRPSAQRGSLSGGAALALLAVILVVALSLAGFTALGLWGDVQRFFGM